MAWTFLRRAYPSANGALLHGPRPVLVDTGFGSDADELAGLLRLHGRPALVVNTHWHSDHVGGNFAMARLGVPIAAHALEAGPVNARDPQACEALRLDQPVEPYAVARPLADGDVIDTGAAAWTVVHTPGHTLGHVSLFEPAERLLALGDLLHGDDVGWLPPPSRSPDALALALDSVARVAALRAHAALSGHGEPIADVAAACEAATVRLRRWAAAPDKIAWHASKRIFTHALIVRGGMTRDEIDAAIPSAGWCADYAATLGIAPDRFAADLVAECLRAGAAAWRSGRLVALAPHRAPAPGWRTAPGMPAEW
jgi:glyoxylase-like metal-dependent hydrolase (beta-lactamase superfamily II)